MAIGSYGLLDQYSDLAYINVIWENETKFKTEKPLVHEVHFE